jgi:hypothetical protein
MTRAAESRNMGALARHLRAGEMGESAPVTQVHRTRINKQLPFTVESRRKGTGEDKVLPNTSCQTSDKLTSATVANPLPERF